MTIKNNSSITIESLVIPNAKVQCRNRHRNVTVQQNLHIYYSGITTIYTD